MIFGNPDHFAVYVDEVKAWMIDKEINGIVGIYIDRKFFLTNYGLISLYNDFENILEISNNIPCNQYIFNLPNIELLKIMLIQRYPNWYANSEKEWEENLDNWNACEENFSFDLSLESFSKGHIGSFHLFGVKSLTGKIKLLFYVKDDEKDFFDFSLLSDCKILSLVVDFNYYISIINELRVFLENKRISGDFM